MFIDHLQLVCPLAGDVFLLKLHSLHHLLGSDLTASGSGSAFS